MKAAIFAVVLTLVASKAHGHGLMIEPPQRGILGGSKFAPFMKSPVPGAPKDHFAHFPAGDKGTTPGAGKRSQERQVKNWTPFEPMKSGFGWRAGVCGDLKSGPQEHLRGGKLYFNGHVARTYRQGGIVKVGTSIIAHHNGYMEIHVCDIKKCGGEISESCFQKGHCHLLERAKNGVCDNGLSKDCAPIDRNFPGRWYMPCSRINGSGFDMYREEFAQFVLPKDLSCDHCVLHWFWTSANNCNPPGVIKYFEGPDGPKKWGKCPGQAGAMGGYTNVQKPCGGSLFPEEYYQCADIRITKDGSRSGNKNGQRSKKRPNSPPPTPSASPKAQQKEKQKGKMNGSPGRAPSPASATALTENSQTAPRVKKPGKLMKKRNKLNPDANSPFKNIKLFADGHVVRKVQSKDQFKLLGFKQITFKVTTTREVPAVYFFIDGKKVWVERKVPYFLFGNGKQPKYWKKPIVNRRFRLEVGAEGYRYGVSMKLIQ